MGMRVCFCGQSTVPESESRSAWGRRKKAEAKPELIQQTPVKIDASK